MVNELYNCDIYYPNIIKNEYKIFHEEPLYIANKYENSDIIKKYLKKLPHYKIQLRLIKEMNIDPRVVILINFQESNFNPNIIHNGNLNKGDYKDWGTLQMNSKWHKEARKYILNSNYESYYRFAYKYLKTRHNENISIWFANWHSKTPKYRKKYIYSFLNRTKKHNSDLRLLLNNKG